MKGRDGIARTVYVARTGQRLTVLHSSSRRPRRPREALWKQPAPAWRDSPITDLAELRNCLLEDPETRAEYETLEPEYGIARELIAARTRAGLGGTAESETPDPPPTGASLDGSDAAPPLPAGAGEPSVLRLDRSHKRAYPRGCGGTAGAGLAGQVQVGLSPRVRGNLVDI